MSGLSGGAGAADAVARIAAALNRFAIMQTGSDVAGEFGEAAVDVFTDETGVNTTSSTNERYDATSDFYDGISDPFSGITPTVGPTTFEGTAANLTDGSASTVWASGTANQATVVIDCGAAVTLAAYAMTAGDGGASTDPASTWTFSGSATGAFAGEQTVLDTQTALTLVDNTRYEYTIGSPQSFRYYKLDVTATLNGNGCRIREVEGIVKNALTLVSAAFTAGAAPASARIVILEKDVDAITLNTDLVASISRDGGTTWSTVTLVDEGDYAGARRVLSGTASLAAQPSGTNMLWRIVGAAAKEFQVHAVALMWGS